MYKYIYELQVRLYKQNSNSCYFVETWTNRELYLYERVNIHRTTSGTFQWLSFLYKQSPTRYRKTLLFGPEGMC